MNDDTVQNVLSRRFGDKITNNLCSAIMHGLCAGNMQTLSARALLPGLWSMERRDQEPGIATEVKYLEAIRQGSAGSLEKEIVPNGGIFTFRGGVHRLVTALTDALQSMSNVSLQLDSRAHSLHATRNGTRIEVRRCCNVGVTLS